MSGISGVVDRVILGRWWSGGAWHDSNTIHQTDFYQFCKTL